MELHTGKLANAYTEKIESLNWSASRTPRRMPLDRGLQVNAGHGINYRNITLIHKIPHLSELNIGHAIVARAMAVGLETAVREMLALMQNYRG